MQITSLLTLSIVLMARGLHLNSAENDRGGMAPASSRQLILVTTAGWNAVDGAMRRYERDSIKHQWKPVGEKTPVVVGRNGMAWGKGLHGESLVSGKDSYPVKKEGDGRSPAGVFSLSSAFGYASRGQTGTVRLPYVEATATLECVDDPQSAHYNKVLDRAGVKNPDWKSSERMRRDDDQYRWGVVVDHNAKGEAGCGSCIFLHIWDAPGKGTAGCTAMESARMEETLRWLDAGKRPVLVQLPQAEFERLRRAWGLP
jgi:D-alanyl-D-alanine dipeptidase